MELSILKVETLIKKFKLSVYPYTILHLLASFDKLQPRMIQDKAKKYIVSPEQCIHCKQKKEYVISRHNKHVSSRNLMCKKHISIYDWSWGNTAAKSAMLTFKERQFCLFTEYAITPMLTDDDGLFVLWFSTLDRDKTNVFGIHKKYFPDIFEKGKDITSQIFKYRYLMYDDSWILDVTSYPLLERVGMVNGG